MDIEIARAILPKLAALEAFINNVTYSGQYLPDNATRANYRAMYADIKATLNDPLLETYAPPLPHLGTTSDDSKLWGEHQIRILESGMQLIAYLQTQLKLTLPPRSASGATSDRGSQDASRNINIENFQGILGNVTNSQVSQELDQLVVIGDFNSLHRKLSDLGVEGEDIEELRAALQSEPTMPASGKFGQRVSNWIGKMVQKAASGTWQIGLSTAASLLAMLIGKYYGL